MSKKSMPILVRDVRSKHVGINVLRVVCCVVVIAVYAFLVYVGIYYRASDYARYVASHSTDMYTVKETDDGIVFMPETVEAGLVFYPGGKVEYIAYAPLIAKFAERGIMCVLVEMPFNLAVFDMNAADDVRKKYRDVPRWYIGGHSLGGAMAASYVSDHADEYEGLILLAAYSTENLRGTGLNVISVYGSQDRVLNREKYKANLKNLPKDYCELVIEGGCHAYFGNYGAQSGDGKPHITRDEQQKLTADFVKDRLDAHKLGSDEFL